MKGIDVILLPLAAAMVIIGAHVTWTQGVIASYPVFMLAVALLLWFKYRKTQNAEKMPSQDKQTKKAKRQR
jgi:flagellar biosynthesis component FlhA